MPGGKHEFGGFVLDAVRTCLKNKKEVDELIHSLSAFNIYPVIESKSNKLLVQEQSALYVFYNLIQRGLPTKLSWRLEQLFCQAFPFIKTEENRGSITSSFRRESPENLTSLLEQAYHVIDPRIKKDHLRDNYQYSWEQLDSTFEEVFYFNTLGNIDGDTAWLLQLIECQRPLTEIVTSDIQNNTLATNFVEQRCDFSLEFPHAIHGKRGIILEVDGKQHNAIPQNKLDEARDEATRTSQWMETIRIPTIHWSSQELLLTDFKNLLTAPFFQNIANNYTKPLYNSREGLVALQLALSPILIARIQKAFLGQILSGCLDLNKETWTICVIERDIPGSSLAIRDIEESILHYSSLIEDEFNLPSIDLHVYSTPEFIEADLHSFSAEKPTLSSSLNECDVDFDLVMDISVLSRDKSWPVQKFIRAPKNYLLLTSAKSRKENRKFHTGQLLPFHQLTTKDQDGKYIEDSELKSTLEIFLADIFRKKEFRPGQLPILDRALSQESVIGLLPTGGGKSMTYQLATFMQPGISIIIDPIKSLMRDQVNSLSMNLIDSAGYVNSSLDREQKEIAHNSLVEGELLFFFMSPERLLIPDFRGVLEATYENGNHFSFCVIDEAHCVSEWGHDFRTSYLFLGRNATLYAKTFSNEPITLFGLTATASYDVLADIQRELSGDIENRDSILSDDAIVRFETFNVWSQTNSVHLI
jgi:ATP-dependent DNA helicase RecQ